MKGGTGNGLELMLDIQQDEYLPVWGETGKFWRFNIKSIIFVYLFSKNFGLFISIEINHQNSLLLSLLEEYLPLTGIFL